VAAKIIADNSFMASSVYIVSRACMRASIRFAGGCNLHGWVMRKSRTLRLPKCVVGLWTKPLTSRYRIVRRERRIFICTRLWATG